MLRICNFLYFIFFALIFCIQPGNAKEKSRFKCAYQLDILKDTSALTYFRQETYIVQIGDNITKGFTYQKFYMDSLAKHNPQLGDELFKASIKESFEAWQRTGDISHVHNNSFHYGAFASDLYKDYKKNEIRVRDNIDVHSFVFTDELQPQDWEILSDTTTILEYASQKAVCHFRGRDWVAWFTPEIPLSEGPWKFYGLPGLITKIHDTKNHYSFELTGFQEREEPIDIKIPKGAQKIERKEFIRSKMGIKGAKLQEATLAKLGISSDKNEKTTNCDYIELDYKD